MFTTPSERKYIAALPFVPEDVLDTTLIGHHGYKSNRDPP
jgi:hypothetical protein